MSLPGVIDGLQFARDGSTKEGRLGLDRLGRLAQMQCTTPGLDYRLRGGIDAEGRAYLRLSVGGSVQLVCQRCLGKLDFPLHVDSKLELAHELREIAQADDDIDRVLAGKDMDVAVLVEDEVILVLPMTPKHEQCSAGPEDRTDVRKSPFGALAGLKKGAAND
jgi:uncharacterized protein